ncbi:hypothetical protein QO059_08590 [Fervidobacterium islandicum]|uniref:hypothetical protein n=1 Tax=Fervidobacterium islandicum TaxID=2423 RepID=UPI003A6EE5DB
MYPILKYDSLSLTVKNKKLIISMKLDENKSNIDYMEVVDICHYILEIVKANLRNL